MERTGLTTAFNPHLTLDGHAGGRRARSASASTRPNTRPLSRSETSRACWEDRPL